MPLVTVTFHTLSPISVGYEPVNVTVPDVFAPTVRGAGPVSVAP